MQLVWENCHLWQCNVLITFLGRVHLCYCIRLKLFPSFYTNQEFWSLALWYHGTSLTLEEISILYMCWPHPFPPPQSPQNSWTEYHGKEMRSDFSLKLRNYFGILKPLWYLHNLFNLTKEGIIPSKDGLIHSHPQTSSVKEFTC